MKNTYLKITAFILAVLILSNNLFSFYVYASEPNSELSQEDIDELADKLGLNDNAKWREGETIFWEWLLAQCGAIWQGDIEQIRKNDNYINTIGNPDWRVQNITTGIKDGKKVVNISKDVSDIMINCIKKETQDTSGYTLMKTVAKSSLHGSSFPSTNAYKTMLKAFQYSECNMVLMRQDKFSKDPTANNNFVKLYYAPLNYSIVNTEAKGNNINNCMLVKKDNVYIFYDAKGATPFGFYYGRNYASLEPPTSEYFSSNQSYSYVLLAHQYDATSPLYNDIGTAFYLVSSTGVSVPVFDSLDAMLDYSVQHNLYYTSSSYTGEGKEISIDYDEIDKILNGYYNGMYDMLQQLIEQTGNGITPEQLQELVDSVQASFGMLKDTINQGFEQQDILIQKNSSILQNIADALNAFFAQQKTFNETIHQVLKDIKTALTKNSGTTSSGSNSGILTELKTIIKDGFDDVVKELKKIRRWTALDTIFDGLDAVADWLDFVTKFFDNVADGVGLLVTGFADTVTELTKVFPFSIPITLVLIVQMFSAPPEAPKFELPLKLDAFNIDEVIAIDLSQFQVISVISRTFLTIIYCVGLYHLTFKIITAKKGG